MGMRSLPTLYFAHVFVSNNLRVFYQYIRIYRKKYTSYTKHKLKNRKGMKKKMIYLDNCNNSNSNVPN